MMHGYPFVAILLSATALCVGQTASRQSPASTPVAAAGYRGVWYRAEGKPADSQPACNGGLATFSDHHVPMAIYAERVKKTFFVYGGSAGAEGERRLQIAVGFYDHSSGRISRPIAITERTSANPNGNPALSIDGEGYLWVFAAGIGEKEPGFVYKNAKPYEIGAFQRVKEMRFADPQPWFIEGKGMLLLFSRVQKDQGELCFTTSRDGSQWSDPTVLAVLQQGCEPVSWRHCAKVGVAFKGPTSPKGQGPAVGVYYLETSDAGQTWTTSQREKAELPIKAERLPALVLDCSTSGQSVWIKDLNFDTFSNPTILYLSGASGTGSPSGPCFWMTARWLSRGWRITGLIQSDNPCDSGCLYIENRSSWRIIAPTSPGPEPDAPGGEVVAWFSDDFGRAWNQTGLTHASQFNHNFVRRPMDARPEFYAFWADGAIRRPSESRLYFTTREGKVFRLPAHMKEGITQPELISEPSTESAPATSESP